MSSQPSLSFLIESFLILRQRPQPFDRLRPLGRPRPLGRSLYCSISGIALSLTHVYQSVKWWTDFTVALMSYFHIWHNAKLNKIQKSPKIPQIEHIHFTIVPYHTTCIPHVWAGCLSVLRVAYPDSWLVTFDCSSWAVGVDSASPFNSF